MLIQPLVQNRIISIDHSNQFRLDWNAAMPILNLNFFHTIQLIEESSKYRKLLRPWEEYKTIEGEWYFNSTISLNRSSTSFPIVFISNSRSFNQLSITGGYWITYKGSMDFIVYRNNSGWVNDNYRRIVIDDASSLSAPAAEQLLIFLSQNATQIRPKLKLHQYYTAIDTVASYNIYPGSWVGRVNTNHPDDMYKDCLVLAAPCQYYIFDYENNIWVLNDKQGVPCILRPALTGLKQSFTNSLESWKLVDRRWQLQINTSQTAWEFQLPQDWWSISRIPIQLEQDLVLGRIKLNNMVIANVPVTILRKWNSQKISYEYALTFPDLNFPPEAEVELY